MLNQKDTWVTSYQMVSLTFWSAQVVHFKVFDDVTEHYDYYL
jgi:hypothetical protein